MLVNTKHFGEIELDEEKIIRFEQGIMGFEEYKNYTLIYDIEEGENHVISWLQSLDDAALALPVINPYLVKTDYDPRVEDELLKSLGEIKEDSLIVFTSLTVPSDVKKMSANLKAPFVINGDTKKGIQVIVENADYAVKYNVYEAIQELKKEKGDA